VTELARAELDYPFDTVPAPGTTLEVAPGIHWVRMPLPFKLNHINLYLLDDGDGWTMIDTGYGNDETKSLWRDVWRRALGGRPISRLFVTHFHPDHVGNAGWLADTLGLTPHMTQIEWLNANLAARMGGSGDVDRRIPWYAQNGLTPDRVAFFRNAYVPYPSGVTLPPAYIRIRDGEEIEAAGAAWEVHVGTGHSPEHACLYSRALNVMLGGDQILPGISPNVSALPQEPDGDPLGDFLESLDDFERYLPEDVLILPSHGRPFRGARQRIDWLRRHHDERLETILSLVDGPKAAAELIAPLFPFEFDGHQLGFAMGEVIAHLNRLVRMGKLERRNGDDGIVRYRPA
jgi:glyoxylase-like metal-dependent hydrolase (beta-lactamase superfamily II)